MDYKIRDNKLVVISLFPPGESDLTNILYMEFRIFDILNMILDMDYELGIADAGGLFVYASPKIKEFDAMNEAETFKKVTHRMKTICFLSTILQPLIGSLSAF